MSNVPGSINARDGPRVIKSIAQHSTTRHDKQYKQLMPTWLMVTVMMRIPMAEYNSPRVFTKLGMAGSTQHAKQHIPVLNLRSFEKH